METTRSRFATLQGLTRPEPRRHSILRMAALCVLCAAATGCGKMLGQPTEFAAITTFTNETAVDAELRSIGRTFPGFSTTLRSGESYTANSRYVWDRYPEYEVRARVGLAAQTLRIKRIPGPRVERSDKAGLEAERITVRLVDDNGRLRARAERGIKVYADPLP